jgi:hypothetical protein
MLPCDSHDKGKLWFYYSLTCTSDYPSKLVNVNYRARKKRYTYISAFLKVVHWLINQTGTKSCSTKFCRQTCHQTCRHVCYSSTVKWRRLLYSTRRLIPPYSAKNCAKMYFHNLSFLEFDILISECLEENS